MSNTYEKFLTRGLSSNLGTTAITDGKLRFTTDTGKLFIDYSNGGTSKRFAISDVVTGNTEAQITSLSNPEDKLYIASDTNRILIRDNNAWESIIGTTPVMNYQEYNSLPSSKLNDGILRFISDAAGAEVDTSVIIANYNPSVTYTRGQYCMYNKVLHRCTAASATGTWDSSKWSATTVGAELSDVNTIYTVTFDKDDWTSSVVSTDYPYEQTVTLSGLDAAGAYQAIVVPADGTAFLSDEEKKIYNNMVWNNNQLTAYASDEPTDDITVQISKRI